MRVRWMRGLVVASFLSAIGVLGLFAVPETRAAPVVGFDNPSFQTQWNTGEALIPNFWGPLANARASMPETWNDATPNGQRTVQYFDKGRMEVSSGGVTAGLLATELITGRVQTGTSSFNVRSVPAIPIAGDATNPGPTFAAFAGPAASLLAPATTKAGGMNPVGIITALDANGTLTTFMPGGDYAAAAIGAFDALTKHNVAVAFAGYRDKVGLTSIGYAISEPFWTNLLVGGERKAVLIEVFERRVLTYTPQNAPAFAVEMGNIGAQYYQWRYETPATVSGTPATASTGTATGTSTSTTIATPVNATAAVATSLALTAFPSRLGLPTPTMPAVLGTPLSSAAAASANGVSFLNAPASVPRGSNATTTVAAPAGAYCTIAVTYRNGASHVDGLTDKTVDASGKVSWTWIVGPGTASGSAPIEVSCTTNGKTYLISATTIVTA